MFPKPVAAKTTGERIYYVPRTMMYIQNLIGVHDTRVNPYLESFVKILIKF